MILNSIVARAGVDCDVGAVVPNRIVAVGAADQRICGAVADDAESLQVEKESSHKKFLLFYVIVKYFLRKEKTAAKFFYERLLSAQNDFARAPELPLAADKLKGCRPLDAQS